MTTGQHHQHGHGHGHGAYDPSNLIRSDAFYGGVYQEIVDWPEGSVAALDMTPDLLQTAREQLAQSAF